MARHNETGKKGEGLAADYLQQQGFSILHQNWRFSRYEIDIIASRENTLHFIEVKTRQTYTYGFPEESVTEKKIESLMTGAEEYLYQNPDWKKIQYDVLSITMEKNKAPEFYLIEDVYL